MTTRIRTPHFARPPRRRVLTFAMPALAACVGLVMVLQASAAKGVLDYFGNSSTATSTAAGEFSTTTGIGGVAVNESGNGSVGAGDVYAVDRGNDRVEEFSAAGAFVRAFGLNVGGAGVDVCTSSCAAGMASAAAGGMSTPEGVAVDQATGNVYVTDQTNHRVDVFSATGTFEGAFGWKVDLASPKEELQFCTPTSGCQAGALGLGAGEFSINLGYPAVAPAGAPNAGDVLVANTQDKRVDEFSVTENATSKVVEGASFVRGIGWGVVSNSDLELQECTSTCVAGLAGSGAGEFATGGPTRVGEDKTGAIYALDPGNFRVQKLTPQTGPPALSASVFAVATLTGTAAASSPLDLAVDPTNSDVYVAKAYEAGKGTPPASVAEDRVLQLSASGELLETTMAGAEIASVNGLAENAAAGQLYVSSTTGAQRVYILGTVPAPAVTLGATTAIMGRSATLNGTVNPDGGALETSYQFEYSKDGVTWTKAPAAAQAIGNGSDDVTVTQPISGLEPNTTYQVRLHATKPFDSVSATTEAQSFTTLTIPPEAAMAGAWWNEPAGLELSGQLNPDNLPTTYYFEYGTCREGSEDTCATSEYEHRAPAAQQASAGEGDTPVLVHQQLTGLQTGAPYHYRLVATNSAGTIAGSNATIASHDSSYVYEQVTPVEKQAHDFSLARAQLTAPGGEAVVVSALAGFLNPEESPNFDGAAGAMYIEHRTPSGWELFGATAPAGLWPGLAATPSGPAYSPELTRVVSCDPVNKLLNSAEEAPFGSACGLREADGSWLAGAIFPGQSNGKGERKGVFVPASSNLSHIFFTPEANLLPADTTRDSTYEMEDPGSPSAVLRLVNVDNSGTEIGGGGSNGTFIGLGAGSPSPFAEQFEAYHAVSDDGDTAYFSGIPSGGVETIYARVNHSQTVTISNPSPTECMRTVSESGGVCNAPAAAAYQGASADGSKVFFTTTQQMVNADTDSTEDVYEYDFDGLPDANVVQVSGGGPSDPSPGAGANVQGVISTSSDGSHVYFVAQGVLTTVPNALGETAVQGTDNVYGYDTESGETRFVAEVCSGSEKSGTVKDEACPAASTASDTPALWEGSNTLHTYRGPVQETLNGNYLVFATYAKLIAAGPEADEDNASDVYRYDFHTGELVRVSVGEPSFAASKNGNTAEENATIAPRPDSSRNNPYLIPYADGNADDAARAISESGETIVFSTPEQLQADDVNGGPGDTSCPKEVGNTDSMAGCDVYVWHYSGPSSSEDQGQVSMVSDGQDPEGADEAVHTIGGVQKNFNTQPSLSADGSNVFFATRTPLVPGEAGAEEMNVYDARIGGGFTGPPAEPTCSGEACQGEPSPPPSFTAAPSSLFTAGQNLTPPLVTSTEPKPKPLTVMITKAKLEGNAVSVSVKTSAKGNVRISGKYLKTTSKTVAAGTHTITVALTKAGRAAMKHHKKTTVRVSLTVGKQVVAKSVTVKL